MRGLAAERLLTDTLGHYSPSGEEAAVAAFLGGAMAAGGLRVWQDAVGNVIGTRGDGPRHVMLVGHIDTVIGAIPVRQEAGRLYGRGAVDAKGPMAAFVAAAVGLGAPPGLRLTVVGAVGEEAQSPGARHLAATWPADERPDLLVIGEPSGWSALTLGYKGSLRAEYVARQTTGHSAGPVESVAETAVAFWQAVVAACAARNADKRLFDQLTPVLRAFNTSSDGFTDEARLSLGFRLPVGTTPEAVEALVRDLAGAQEVRFSGSEPAYRGEKSTPLVRAFLAAIRAVGGEPGFKLKTGTADMNILAPAWGCPCIAYGPGDSSLDHTPEEHILLEDYHRAILVLDLALRRLAS
jgi:[amino group carrier protein]-lysine/ornithine hydrolase